MNALRRLLGGSPKPKPGDWVILKRTRLVDGRGEASDVYPFQCVQEVVGRTVYLAPHAEQDGAWLDCRGYGPDEYDLLD